MQWSLSTAAQFMDPSTSWLQMCAAIKRFWNESTDKIKYNMQFVNRIHFEKFSICLSIVHPMQNTLCTQCAFECWKTIIQKWNDRKITICLRTQFKFSCVVPGHLKGWYAMCIINHIVLNLSTNFNTWQPKMNFPWNWTAVALFMPSILSFIKSSDTKYI